MDYDFLTQLQAENEDLKVKNHQLNTALSSSNFNVKGERNPIEYQLDTQEMLDRLEHFLKGDILVKDEEGNVDWKKQDNPDLIFFNEYGVNSIMIIIGSYIDKDTALSRYSEERIYEILADLGDELSKFIFCNYERMGLDTQFKKSRYGIVVLMILHKIESTYRRAIMGKTSEDINTSHIYTHSEIMGNRGGINSTPIKKKFNPFKPSTW